MVKIARLPLIGVLAIAASFAGAPAPAHATEQFSGKASFYSEDYSGKTANGESYDPKQFTAAHRTLPFGTLLRITASNNRTVDVVITDRGPFLEGRVLDLSMAAAQALGMIARGVFRVTAEVQQPRAIHLNELISGEPAGEIKPVDAGAAR